MEQTFPFWGLCLIFRHPGPSFSSKGLDPRLERVGDRVPQRGLGTVPSGVRRGEGSRVQGYGRRSPPPKGLRSNPDGRGAPLRR